MFRTGDETIDHRCLQEITESEKNRGNRDERDKGVEIQESKSEHGDVHRHRHNFAMREVDDARNAEDDGQAERHQAVDQPREHARDDDVGEIDEIDGHGKRRIIRQTRVSAR